VHIRWPINKDKSQIRLFNNTFISIALNKFVKLVLAMIVYFGRSKSIDFTQLKKSRNRIQVKQYWMSAEEINHSIANVQKERLPKYFY